MSTTRYKDGTEERVHPGVLGMCGKVTLPYPNHPGFQVVCPSLPRSYLWLKEYYLKSSSQPPDKEKKVSSEIVSENSRIEAGNENSRVEASNENSRVEASNENSRVEASNDNKNLTKDISLSKKSPTGSKEGTTLTDLPEVIFC